MITSEYMKNNEEKAVFAIERNGQIIELSETEARQIYEAYHYQCMREDIEIELEGNWDEGDLEDYGYKTDDLSEQVVQEMTRYYQRAIDNDESWWYCCNGAIRAWLEDHKNGGKA